MEEPDFAVRIAGSITFRTSFSAFIEIRQTSGAGKTQSRGLRKSKFAGTRMRFPGMDWLYGSDGYADSRGCGNVYDSCGLFVCAGFYEEAVLCQ